jgi:hypothetical protein
LLINRVPSYNHVIFAASRIVFSNRVYIAVAISVAIPFWILFNYFDQLLFFSPMLTFYLPIPKDAIPGFIISNITSALVGIVVSVNVYYYRHYIFKYQKKKKENSDRRNARLVSRRPSLLFSATTVFSLFSSTCASCSSVVPFILSIIGAGATGGAMISSFLLIYHIPLRIISIAILVWTFYVISKKLTDTTVCVNNAATYRRNINSNNNVIEKG